MILEHILHGDPASILATKYKHYATSFEELYQPMKTAALLYYGTTQYHKMYFTRPDDFETMSDEWTAKDVLNTGRKKYKEEFFKAHNIIPVAYQVMFWKEWIESHPEEVAEMKRLYKKLMQLQLELRTQYEKQSGDTADQRITDPSGAQKPLNNSRTLNWQAKMDNKP